MGHADIAGNFPPGFVPVEQFVEVLAADNRSNLLIGGLVDKTGESLTLWRGDLTSLVVPFSAFPPASDGSRPDFNDFAVTDFGHTVRLGNYEVGTDTILAGFKAVPRCWE